VPTETPAGCSIVNLGCDSELIRSQYFTPLVESYSEVRGYVMGYQGHSTDGFGANGGGDVPIDQAYVDGVSITVGSPRRHVWTYGSGLMMSGGGHQNCPCDGGQMPPAFVSDDYFCDSGNPGPDWPRVWHTANPLWDDDSTLGGTCENVGTPNWFQKPLGETTSGALEVRLMVNQCDDDIAVTRMELYVR
jgi:dynein heavy chain